ncbi:sensor histidine kinase [Microbacterium tumbae]
MSLQTRLMAAVIGFVSLILIIVALITSATLGRTLEEQLSNKLHNAALQLTSWVGQRSQTAAFLGNTIDAESLLDAFPLQNPGLILAIARNPDLPANGAIVATDGVVALTDAQLVQLDEALTAGSSTVTLTELGSYSMATAKTPDDIVVVTALPRDEIQNNLTSLFTVLAMATLGGLILLALTTAITIRLGLRPLRAVAATANRVANQPLDRGEVSITERVPAAEADPRTETGLVGSALNTLLDHVDASLAARQKNEERMRRFVADASHELRTPLASIRGYSELSLKSLAKAREQGEEQAPAAMEGTTSAMERIQAQSLRMTRLVEDLLLLARLDEGRELVYGTVDLTQLAIEGLSDARPTGPDHRWSIDVPEEPVVILGDAGRLHQVVSNLLANARTHTPAGTSITLSVSAEGEEALLRVHDDGPGIDPAVREELFARFARGDGSRARQTGGTGLGLAIAKAIVEGHHGELSVESSPGSTTFTVRIPFRPELSEEG